MNAWRQEKSKQLPLRSCIGCGHKRMKCSLRRLVVNMTGQLTFDLPQLAPGRGAYLCGGGCLQAAVKRKAFQRAFRGQVQALELSQLESALQSSP